MANIYEQIHVYLCKYIELHSLSETARRADVHYSTVSEWRKAMRIPTWPAVDSLCAVMDLRVKGESSSPISEQLQRRVVEYASQFGIKETARRAGVYPSVVSRWVNDVRFPGPHDTVKITDLLQLKVVRGKGWFKKWPATQVNYWTEKELAYLEKNYPRYTAESIAEVLGRSEASVYAQALRLKK